MLAISLIHPRQQAPVQVWEFDDSCSSIRIGRSPLNEVSLLSAVVSRQHALVEREGPQWQLTAKGANGCFVNDKGIKNAIVEDGLIIRLGKTGPRLLFEIKEVESKTTTRRKSLIHDELGVARNTWVATDSNPFQALEAQPQTRASVHPCPSPRELQLRRFKQ